MFRNAESGKFMPAYLFPPAGRRQGQSERQKELMQGKLFASPALTKHSNR
jgi:hypothetical protein